MSTKSKELPFVVHEAEEGGYWAEAIGFNIYTQGETLDELRLMIVDAIECHFGDSID